MTLASTLRAVQCSKYNGQMGRYAMVRTRTVRAVMVLALMATVGACSWFSHKPDCCLPHGAIGARYIAIGGEDSPLGRCNGGETERDGGRAQSFTNGAIYWTDTTGAWEVYGQISNKYTDVGGPTSGVGWPTSGELTTPNNMGRYNRFEHGGIYFSESGTHPVYGAIFDEWGRQGFESGRFGFPTSDEVQVPDGRQTNFQGGWIRWITESDQILTS
ncbi:trehalose corynomycolyl transferase [Rhodococcus sp. IEGM 1318]|uniref:LGFP repeat-containing protein n=1 Tax=Rhodococcus sp. IEGM 1318 TaxID=3082226 RepID=UPI002955AA3C|nr:trehalose corynomycolyl transferase [Rhodococcus sp. IEGM 1318]MDV8009188.1 trehalose corynomycolyl transferase [Rhodococcus sp. IEGM 1318]